MIIKLLTLGALLTMQTLQTADHMAWELGHVLWITGGVSSEEWGYLQLQVKCGARLLSLTPSTPWIILSINNSVEKRLREQDWNNDELYPTIESARWGSISAQPRRNIKTIDWCFIHEPQAQREPVLSGNNRVGLWLFRKSRNSSSFISRLFLTSSTCLCVFSLKIKLRLPMILVIAIQRMIDYGQFRARHFRKSETYSRRRIHCEESEKHREQILDWGSETQQVISCSLPTPWVPLSSPSSTNMSIIFFDLTLTLSLKVLFWLLLFQLLSRLWVRLLQVHKPFRGRVSLLPELGGQNTGGILPGPQQQN